MMKATFMPRNDASGTGTKGRRSVSRNSGTAAARKAREGLSGKTPASQNPAFTADGRELAALRRVIIEGVRPEVDEGRLSAKGTVGEPVVVEADIYADGHDLLAADLLFHNGDGNWIRLPMTALVNDRWTASFAAARLTTYVFTIEAWVDHFATWQQGLAKKSEAGQDVTLDLLAGARLIDEALPNARAQDIEPLRNAAARLSGRTAVERRIEAALAPELAARMRDAVNRRLATRYQRELRVQIDPPKAAFSAWYEMFPRSASPDKKRAGTFRDVEARLPYVAGMGFDVLYLPPVHPIGKTKRKGANNTVTAKPGDPGSPWAIGSEAGGHKSVNPHLGSLEDFRRLVRKAKDMGVYVALDIAFQCSPDHPYVKEHPEWFRLRPDGSVQFAENPPKKYEDIYPFNFETPAWESLWQELLSVFLFWMEQGVTVFRVDNPHTKPFAFWEWLIAEVHKVDAGVIFLAEAFTRPKIMYRLAKLGFTQSYTYFTWRPDKRGLTEYFTELTTTPVCDFFRPNAWPNTPDILTEQMQTGGRAMFVARLLLAATLSSNYGIYGPPFELMEHDPREKGSEEYLHSEKYQVRHWDVGRGDSLRDLITIVNRARKDNPALQTNAGLRFHGIDNDQLIAYSKARDGNTIIVAVNLDPRSVQSGWLTLPLEDLDISPDEPFQVHDLLSDARYTWQGPRNFIRLDPNVIPAHLFRVRRRVGAAGWEFE
jgi:starch synthase (maltosyl-transferring)